jgi:CBS domain-containing protein
MLQVRDVMTRDVITVSPEHTLREAMEVLSRHHVTGAPVVRGQEVVGVVSGSDLMEFAAALPPVTDAEVEPLDLPDRDDDALDLPDEDAEEQSASWFLARWRDERPDANERIVDAGESTWSALDEHTVSEVMTRGVVALRPTVSLAAAADLMRRKRLHRVLVMEGTRLVGILSTTDVVAAVADGRLTRTRWVFSGGVVLGSDDQG